MRQSISRIAPIVMGLTIAAFDVVMLPAAARPATPGPDLLGVSQSATAPTNPGLGTPPPRQAEPVVAPAGRRL